MNPETLWKYISDIEEKSSEKNAGYEIPVNCR